jgi:serine phosphatase RsbU (regulator of sigma subunit)
MAEKGGRGGDAETVRRLITRPMERTGLVRNGRASQIAAIALMGMALTLIVFARAAPGDYRGVPAVLVLQAATVVAVAWGPLPGAAAALLGAAGFNALISNQSRGSAWTLLLWPLLAGGLGLVARHLGRRQLLLREQHAATARMLDLLPRLTAPTLEGTLQAIAVAARDVLRADGAALWQVCARDHLLLMAAAGGGGTPGRGRRQPGSTVRIPVPSTACGDCVIELEWHASRDPLTEIELATSERLASLAALAIEQASREHAQAELSAMTARLQAGLLPEPNIVQPEFQVRTLYRPGERRLLLGGDFYDVVETDRGGLMVLIGDVSGHGVDAAALAARMRSSWRALAVTGTPVHALAHQLDTIFRLESTNPEMFATACLAEIAPDHATVQLVLAGHPPPMLIARGEVRLLHQEVQAPLGLADAPASPPPRHPLGGHWTLLFLTDGLFEGRRMPEQPQRLGLDDLLEEVTTQVALAGHPIDLDLLVNGVEGANGGELDDDVALVMVTREPQRTMRLPVEEALSG